MPVRPWAARQLGHPEDSAVQPKRLTETRARPIRPQPTVAQRSWSAFWQSNSLATVLSQTVWVASKALRGGSRPPVFTNRYNRYLGYRSDGRANRIDFIDGRTFLHRRRFGVCGFACITCVSPQNRSASAAEFSFRRYAGDVHFRIHGRAV